MQGRVGQDDLRLGIADLFNGVQRSDGGLERGIVGKSDILGRMDHDPPGDIARILAAMRSAVASGPGSTLVLIAYRKATIGLADEVLFLDGGRIADRGSHADLLARNPAYARLVNAYEEVTAT